jgi:hypothetical protein
MTRAFAWFDSGWPSSSDFSLIASSSQSIFCLAVGREVALVVKTSPYSVALPSLANILVGIPLPVIRVDLRWWGAWHGTQVNRYWTSYSMVLVLSIFPVPTFWNSFSKEAIMLSVVFDSAYLGNY